MKYSTIFVALFAMLSQAQAAEISIYRGFYSTHIINSYSKTLAYTSGEELKIESEFNNDNDLMSIKINNFLFGHMINSYENESYFIGWQPRCFTWNNFYVEAGFMAISGYTKGSLGEYPLTIGGDNYNDEQITFAPIFSAGYSITNHLSAQVNNMGSAFNVGLRFDF
jgi:hypothetical protein